jgi:hypothetical protein
MTDNRVLPDLTSTRHDLDPGPAPGSVCLGFATERQGYRHGRLEQKEPVTRGPVRGVCVRTVRPALEPLK